MMTGPERLEFLAYAARYPIDDESNHHVPVAQLAQLYANAHRKDPESNPPMRLDEFLVFMPKPDAERVAELDDELDRDIANFFLRRS